MSFKYFQTNVQALDQDRARDAHEAQQQAGANAFLLQPGVTVLRILPPFNERGVWYRELQEYSVVLNGQRRFFTAPSQFGLPDPIQEKREELLNKGGEANLKLAEQLKLTRRYLFNAVIWSAPPGVETRKEIVILKAPVTVKRLLLELDRDVQGGWANITDIANGVNLRVSRTGKDLQTRYTVSPMPNRTNLATDIQTNFGLDLNTLSLHDLDAVYAPLGYDELKALFQNFGAGVVPAAAVPVPVSAFAPNVQPAPSPVVPAPVLPIPNAGSGYVSGLQLPIPPPPKAE